MAMRFATRRLNSNTACSSRASSGLESSAKSDHSTVAFDVVAATRSRISNSKRAVTMGRLVLLESIFEAHPVEVIGDGSGQSVHDEEHAPVACPSDELNAAPQHVLAHETHQRMLDQRGRGGLRLTSRVLGSNLLSLASEHRREPVRVEDVHHRVDQEPALQSTDQLAGATHRELSRTGHVNDRIVRPVGDQTATARGRCKPRRSGMSHTPDAELALFDVHSDQRRLERCRRSQAPELVRREGTTLIEPQAQNTLVGYAIFGQLVDGREQKAKARRPSLFRREGSLERDGKSFAEKLS